MEERLQMVMKLLFKKPMAECSDNEIFEGLMRFVKLELEGLKPISGKKKVYYIQQRLAVN